MKLTPIACQIAVWPFVFVLVLFYAAPTQASESFFDVFFDLELTELNLAGGPYPMPLASDPANQNGDSIDGYGFVDSNVRITLSSQRAPNAGPHTVGLAHATNYLNQQFIVSPNAAPINPAVLDGQTFFVDSFFDVFFDITVTDVDTRAGRDYAGQPDGASLVFSDNGPAQILSNYTVVFDKDAPNFGLIPPPEASFFTGFIGIEIPLGGDINGNSENDKIKFELGTVTFGDGNRGFTELPDGSVLSNIDMAAYYKGAVVDESTDPPFTLGSTVGVGTNAPSFSGPGALSGPTTATSTLQNPIVPEPGAGVLLTLLVAAAVVSRRR
ncbi:MAG: hypothetical protein ACYTGQ_09395 [Planctomycetota bacterium]|jgi:hypothetical protein